MTGNCTQQITRYYYDNEARECKQFTYSGCNGNWNNFEQQDECNFRCVCSRSKDVGVGQAKNTRYFFNDNSKRCESFVYKGFGGNKNRFFSRQNCEDMCEPIRSKCKARPDFGKVCDRRIPATHYYYDINSGVCSSFVYLGCSGSKNRFSSLERCQASCTGRRVTPPTPKPDVCFYQPVAGPCDQRIIRYYYDYTIKRCLSFIYSGCAGNGNNFISEQLCSQKCSLGVIDSKDSIQ